MTWFFIFIACILVLAFLIDRKRKKNNNHSVYTGSNDSTHYQYGDYRNTGGGGDIGGGGEQ